MIDVTHDDSKGIILKLLIKELYEPAFEQEFTKIGEIVQENINVVLNTSDKKTVRYVKYANKDYFNQYLPNVQTRIATQYGRYTIDPQVELLPVIRLALISAIASKDTVKEEQHNCETYLRNLLNLCNSVADIVALLPIIFNDILKKVYILDPMSIATLSEETIKEFKHNWAEAEITAKERIFLNLLTRV